MKESLMKLFQQYSFLSKVFAIPTNLIVIATGAVLYCIPSRLIEKEFRNNSEYFFIEINLRKKKWRLCCSYNPNKNSISTHRELDLHSSNYEKFILLRNLQIFCNISNLNISNLQFTIISNLQYFYNLYLLKALIKKPTCFKNPENLETINLILTNRPSSFCNSDTLETGLFRLP